MSYVNEYIQTLAGEAALSLLRCKVHRYLFDREYVNLKHPKLSALLTGTPKQVSSLITDAENGLFSRFIFYYLSTKVMWQNVFEQSGDRTLDDQFRALGEELPRLAASGSSTAGQKTIRRQLFLDKLPESFSRKEFIDISASLGIPLKTAERHISQWCKVGVIERVDHGQYVKK